MIEKPKRGGKRPGAGRKPAPKPETVVVDQGERDMLELLQDIAVGLIEVSPIQLRAAIAAVQYTHTKRSDGGKKEEQQEAAKKAAGKFARQAPPKLVAVNGQPA